MKKLRISRKVADQAWQIFAVMAVVACGVFIAWPTFPVTATILGVTVITLAIVCTLERFAVVKQNPKDKEKNVPA